MLTVGMFSLTGFENEIAHVGSDIRAVLRTVRGLLVHESDLALYGYEPPGEDYDRSTLPLVERLAAIKAADPAPLTSPRPVEKRAVGTCRDYALMTCGLLRHAGVAARVRCGFAAYLVPGFMHDHWICEYRVPDETRWRRADAQLDDVQCRALKIGFDTADMPADAFSTADEAWAAVRAGEAHADDFGYGGDTGEWFLWVNLARDRLALANRIMSPWDGWRDARGLKTELNDAERAKCDALAQEPALPGDPFWR